MLRFFTKKTDDLPRRRRAALHTDAPAAFQAAPLRTFRRNQTLTGSASAHVQTIREDTAHIKSPRVHVHLLARQRRRLGFLFATVCLVAGLLYALMSQFTAMAVVQASPDASLQLDSAYAASIESYLQSQPLERLKFLLNPARLQAYMQAAHPEIQTIKAASQAGLGTTRFMVTPREPVAGWNVKGNQEYVDASGVAFTKNYFAAPTVQIVDQSGLQVSAGQPLASNRFLGYVGQIVGLARQQGLNVTQVTIPAGTTRQIDLTFSNVSYLVKLSINRPAGEQVEDMSRAIAWMRQQNLTPKYIDVRVSGRAFYQ